jgi:SET domain-containing protein
MKLTDKSYLMRLGEQCYVDSKHSHFCEARFINDCRNQAGYNVRFSKKPEQYKAEVIAIRPINKNEELFVDYGRWYWLGHKVKPHRLTFSDLIRLKNSTCESYY